MALIALAIVILAVVILFREEIRRFLGEVGEALAVAIPLWLVWFLFGGSTSFQVIVVIAVLSVGLVKLSAYMRRKTDGNPSRLTAAGRLQDDHERGVINDHQYEEARKALNANEQ